MARAQEYQRIKNKLSDRWWRLNNLYYIKDKTGKKIKFKLNDAQKDLYDNLHYINVILKARQLGFTTFAMIYFLDACLFNSNHSAGVIAHTQNDAIDLFDNKIKYAYDNLPEWLKEAIPSVNDSARKLSFVNGSQIYTGTSLRGGTLQKLLISEYGKISAKFPEKAKEIKTGALNTVEAGQQIFIESTAEGKSGEFYEICEKARKLSDLNKPLSNLEPKFFFYPWWKNPEYKTTDTGVMTAEYLKLFNEYKEQGIDLSVEQKNWYIFKADQQGEDMTQEFPTTPDEAFQGSMKGAFYTKEMKALRDNGQITSLPYDSRSGVYTWWDLGVNDLMTVLFYQFINGRHHFIDYHESDGQGWEYYAKMLMDKSYNYIKHNFPHDGNKRIRGAQIFTDLQMAQQCGIRPVQITPRTSNTYNDIMNFCKPVLVNCWFDNEKCSKIIKHLDNYRRVWSKADGMFEKEPLHDESSHGADAFRTFAVNADKIIAENTGKPRVDPFARTNSNSSWLSS